MKRTLLVDIGNTSVDVLSIPDKSIRLKWDRGWKLSLRHLLAKTSFSEMAIVSVVPKKTKEILELASELSLERWLLGPKEMRDFSVAFGYAIGNIEILGGDLFCDLVAQEEKDGLIVLDCGTATKILALTPDRTFLGGALLPGLGCFPLGLTKKAALIPTAGKAKEIPLLSLKTDECVASGTFYGTAFLLQGYVRHLQKRAELKRAKVVLTGGNAAKILPFLDEDFRKEMAVDFDWCLKGLLRCHEERNRFPSRESSQTDRNLIE